MSKVKIKGNASGNGVLTIEAPNTNTDSTITLPDGTGELIQADASGNVGIGVTPESWFANQTALQIGGTGATLSSDIGAAYYSNNAYRDAAGDWKRIGSGYATRNMLYNGGHYFAVTGTSTADSAISWTTAMTIDNAGRVTMPYQPYFYATNTGAGSQAGDGFTTTPAIFPTAVKNVGNCLSNTNSRFTAPVAGLYSFSGNPGYKQSSVDFAVRANKNGTDLTDLIRLIGGNASHSGLSFGMNIYLNANDYIELNMQASGAKAYHRNNGSVPNWWSGALLWAT